jgi:hypothetical protein
MSFEPRLLHDGTVCCSHAHLLCARCEQHHASRGSRTSEVRLLSTSQYAPPDPYAPHLNTLRAAHEATSFEDTYKAARRREFEAEALRRREGDGHEAHDERLRFAAAAAVSYPPPDPYRWRERRERALRGGL